jgi:hypothetical protein
MAKFEFPSLHLSRVPEESHEEPVRIAAGLQAVILTCDLPNTKQVCYPLNCDFGVLVVIIVIVIVQMVIVIMAVILMAIYLNCFHFLVEFIFQGVA